MRNLGKFPSFLILECLEYGPTRRYHKVTLSPFVSPKVILVSALLVEPTMFGILLNPLTPNIKLYILLTVLHTFLSYGTGKENLSTYQDILSLVITFFILIT